MSAKVIPPVALTTPAVTTSVPETAPAAYNSGTTYALNARASVAGSAGLISVYQSLQASNTNHTPASSPTWWQLVGTTYQLYNTGTAYSIGDMVIDAAAHLVYRALIAGSGNPLTDTTKWFKVGYTNAWAMFNLLDNAATSSPAGVPVTVVVSPGARADSLVMRGLKATSVSVTVRVAGNVVYSATRNLAMRMTLSWSDYYFGNFTTKDSLGLFDLPPYSNSEITIVITNTSGSAACSNFLIGRAEKLGNVRRGVTADVLNFSTVNRDSTGYGEMVPARNVPKVSPEIYQDKEAINKMRALRDSLNGSIAAWVGIDNDSDMYFETMLTVGFYRRFSIVLRDNVGIIITLELEEI